MAKKKKAAKKKAIAKKVKKVAAKKKTKKVAKKASKKAAVKKPAKTTKKVATKKKTKKVAKKAKTTKSVAAKAPKAYKKPIVPSIAEIISEDTDSDFGTETEFDEVEETEVEDEGEDGAQQRAIRRQRLDQRHHQHDVDPGQRDDVHGQLDEGISLKAGQPALSLPRKNPGQNNARHRVASARLRPQSKWAPASRRTRRSFNASCASTISLTAQIRISMI